jgi:hypothetical protein
VPSDVIDQEIQGIRDLGYKPVLEDEPDKQEKAAH